MATIKTSDTKVVIENLGTKLLDLLHAGSHTGEAIDELGFYMVDDGADAGPGQTVQYAITDTKATQAISTAYDNGKSAIKYTLSGTDLKDFDLAHASKLVFDRSSAFKTFDAGSGITQTDKNNFSSAVTLTVNPYTPTALEVSKIVGSGQQSTLMKMAGASLNIVGTTTMSFLGLEQYHRASGTTELQNITINSYSVALKGTNSGTYDGVPFGGNSTESFALNSKGGLSYDTSSGQLTGALDSLSYVSYHTTKADGYSETVEHRYSAGALTPEILDALAGALAADTYATRKAALFSGDDIVSGVAKHNNYLEAGAGNDRVTGHAFADTLYGDEGNDLLFGLGGTDTLYGGDGDDVLDGGADVDTMSGGDGDDTYVLDDQNELSKINRNGAADHGSDTLRITYKGGTIAVPSGIDLTFFTLPSVENVVITGTGVFDITGNSADNIFKPGKNISTMTGGLGNDTYYVAVKGMTVIESAVPGNDTVISSITYALGANVENLTLMGTAAINGTGNELENILIGNQGANVLDGGAGADNLAGGKGNDTYIVDDRDDVVTEELNAGIDTVKASFDYTLGANLENLTLVGSDDAGLWGIGNELNNTIIGNTGNNYLAGMDGVDKLIGGKGDDVYYVSLAVKGTGSRATVGLEDTVVETKGGGDHDSLILHADRPAVDVANGAAKTITVVLAANLENMYATNTGAMKLNLTGNAANNSLTGNNGDNVIIGGAGNDVIEGAGGEDVIVGGLGTDVMLGGTGNDTFRFDSVKDLGLDLAQDLIMDFTSGEDVLSFKGFKGWSFDTTASQASGAKQLWAVVDGANTTVYGNSGGSLDADFAITLIGTTTLAGADIVFA
ncbi:calcium-binding protein [Pseudomonas turukhanskensis]|uniref:Calcium-binding protein n=1 Tax=Pseudomonas turukhanskensis TaxID=1806536 RepID=A0A9W6KAR9_9PSED|nr:hypothetical protein [Pseudomonas turukhanskensis]GLK90815.1 hypothetical protein GCM10017655_38790 [Pseudomonas turukhanskensis]